MAHRAPLIPLRPIRSTAAFRVTAARASDVVLADRAGVEQVVVPAGSEVDTKDRPRRRRRSSTSAPTAAVEALR
jgi:hypothetical protein